MNSTSVSLLKRLQSDQKEIAWERFVELYAPLIFYWAKKHGLNPTDQTDLVQEVLVIVQSKLEEFQYDPKRRFRGWLRTITINKANDVHRRNARRPESGHEETIIQVTTENEADLFAEQEYRRFLVKRALNVMQSEFPESTWKACYKSVVEGQPAAQIARDLDITVNMVYLAKSRVLGRLREELTGLVD